jgi:hypothetical protein
MNDGKALTILRVLGLTVAMTISSSLAGCSWTDAAKLLTPAANRGITADTELTVGKKEEEVAVDTQIGDNTQSTQTAKEIVNTTNSGLTTFQLVLFALLAGWALPDPQTMARGVKSFLQILLPWA